MFISSATVMHENMLIAINEERYSFIFYTAGGLFHYVWYNRLMVKELVETDTRIMRCIQVKVKDYGLMDKLDTAP